MMLMMLMMMLMLTVMTAKAAASNIMMNIGTLEPWVHAISVDRLVQYHVLPFGRECRRMLQNL